jgi:hypothetical protein
VKYSYTIDFMDGEIDFSLNLGTYKSLQSLAKLYLQSEIEAKPKVPTIEYTFELKENGQAVFNPRFQFAGDASSWLIERLGLKEDEAIPKQVFLAMTEARSLFKR